MILLVFNLIALAGIVYQDFKTREVSLYLFLLAFCLSICHVLFNFDVNTILINIGLNAIFILVQLFIIVLFSRFRFPGERKKLTELLGAGDLLFFVILAVNLSVYWFVLFSCISYLTSLVIFIRNKHKTIPLAGVQAALFSIVCIIRALFDYSFFENDIIIRI